MFCPVDQQDADRTVRRPHDQSGSTHRQVRRPATGQTRAAESTKPGRTSEPDAAALGAAKAAVPPACLVHQVPLGRMGEAPGEAVDSCSRWDPPEAPGLAVPVRQSRMGSALRGSVPAPPAGGRARTASRGRRRGSETCQQSYLGEKCGPATGLPAPRRGFSLDAVGTADTGRDLPQGFFPDSRPKGFPGVHSHRGGSTASPSLIAQVPQVRRAKRSHQTTSRFDPAGHDAGVAWLRPARGRQP